MSKVNGFEFKIDKKLVFTNTVIGDYQTSGSVVKLLSVFIPANSFSANDVLVLQYRAQKTLTSGTATMQFYWNTSDTLTSATQLSTRGIAAANVSLAGYRRLAVRTSNNNTLISAVSYAQDTDYSNWVNVNPSTVSIDWTVDSYILLGGFGASSNPVRGLSLNISN